ncbi:uncharacterized protein LOC107027540 [Solanum pennellii]|uniref:Uncharacterized protein LOC107027540 n=1 Tax=Solanum pennellii TaxID=28526 RepID=A0ABM1HE33_SOLPN|nr:uncharacterized protein LOC107027540 [Solanum pennellii]
MVEIIGQSSTTPGTGGNIIDVSNPLYIHPSDNPSLILVPVSFEGVGYRSWRRGVMRSLSVKNKLGFITGKLKRSSSTSPMERCDNMVISWILNSLSKDIADRVEYVSDAVKSWKELEDRYDQTNGAKLFQIQNDINDLSQGDLDYTLYYTRMKKLWEELSNLSIKNQCSCTCSCGGKETMHKAEQDRRLIQFLMGLNEVYTVIRGSILMMNPLPSMAHAFALLVQEEKQREFKPHSHMFAEGSSLNSSIRVGSSNPSGGRVNSTNASSSNSSGGRVFRTNYSSSNYLANNRPRPFCEHCRRPGHIIDKC